MRACFMFFGVFVVSQVVEVCSVLCEKRACGYQPWGLAGGGEERCFFEKKGMTSFARMKMENV